MALKEIELKSDIGLRKEHALKEALVLLSLRDPGVLNYNGYYERKTSGKNPKKFLCLVSDLHYNGSLDNHISNKMNIPPLEERKRLLISKKIVHRDL